MGYTIQVNNSVVGTSYDYDRAWDVYATVRRAIGVTAQCQVFAEPVTVYLADGPHVVTCQAFS